MASQRVLASDSGARTVAAVPPLRRSQALHPPDVMVTGFCPYPASRRHHGRDRRADSSPSARPPLSLAGMVSPVAPATAPS